MKKVVFINEAIALINGKTENDFLDTRLLREGKYTDTAIVLYLAKKFITKFSRWKAFELGIIDEKGKILKKRLVTREEKNSFTMLDRFILKIRTLVGDQLFLKLGITALLLADFKDEGHVIEEKIAGTDLNFLRKLKEDVLGNITTIVIPLEGRKEYIKMDFEKSGGLLSFGISAFIKGNMISTIGGNFLPVNDSNKKFFKDLNDVFSNLRYGDTKNLFVDLGDEDITVNVTYGTNEIKFGQVSDDNDNIHSDLYMLFGNDSERSEFLQGWAKYYKEVSTALNI